MRFLSLVLVLGGCAIRTTLDESAEKALTSAADKGSQLIRETADHAGALASETTAQAGTEAREILQAASEEAKSLLVEAGRQGDTLIKQAGAEARITITHAATELESKGKVLVDHAADRAEGVVAKVPEATQKTADQTEDLLGTIKEWWISILTGTVGVLLAAFSLYQRRKAVHASRAASVVVQAVESMGEGGEQVKDVVAEHLKGSRDEHVVRSTIRKLKGVR